MVDRVLDARKSNTSALRTRMVIRPQAGIGAILFTLDRADGRSALWGHDSDTAFAPHSVLRHEQTKGPERGLLADEAKTGEFA